MDSLSGLRFVVVAEPSLNAEAVHDLLILQFFYDGGLYKPHRERQEFSGYMALPLVVVAMHSGPHSKNILGAYIFAN